jgi:ribosomal protein S7
MNMVMVDGKKSVAEKIVYGALEAHYALANYALHRQYNY